MKALLPVPYKIVLVGDGAASALVSLHLARAIGQPGHRSPGIEIVIIGPNRRIGDGTAFGTPDRAHLLNVPADSMSAIRAEPDHFVHWLDRRDGAAPGPDAFAPRRDFGDYLRETLCAALDRTEGAVSLTHRRGLATGIEQSADGLAVRLGDGELITAQSVVLATGLPPAGISWAPFELRHSGRFVADPWAPGALAPVHAVGDRPDVLLVGTGLTMVDVALSLCRSADGTERIVYAVSRSGRLPSRHRAPRQPPATPDISDWGDDLASIQANARRHITQTQESLGDWRPAVDGLRYRAAELWSRLGEADRDTLLRTCAGSWNRTRHRIPSASAADLDLYFGNSRLVVRQATPRAAQQLHDGVRVTFDDGSTRDFGWVVNCTGPRDRQTGLDPLLDDLVRRRDGDSLAQLSSAGMGVRTVDGRLLDSAGSTRTPIWAVGALRRGELYESTAIPEIRTQAEEVALAILDEAQSRPDRSNQFDVVWANGRSRRAPDAVHRTG